MLIYLLDNFNSRWNIIPKIVQIINWQSFYRRNVRNNEYVFIELLWAKNISINVGHRVRNKPFKVRMVCAIGLPTSSPLRGALTKLVFVLRTVIYARFT